MAERRVPGSHVDEIRDWLEQRRAELENRPHGHLVIDWGDESITYDLAPRRTAAASRLERVPRRAVRRLAG